MTNNNYYDNSSSNYYYKIKPGDTLWSIAKKYNTTIEDLQHINNLKSTSVSSLEYIVIFNNVIVHEVAEGDTVKSICEMYNVYPDNITSTTGHMINSIVAGSTILLHLDSIDKEEK